MRILLANPRGFCAGVNMAIETLNLALERFEPPIYVYHEIVHNLPVVRHFKSRGVQFVDSVEEVPEDATLLFSAHGVSPEIRALAEKRNVFAIDATCPLVTKVHNEAIRFDKLGYQILLIGHEGHDEVLGTMGEAPDAITLVQSVEEVESLTLDPTRPIAYLTQTTLSVDDATRIIEALKKRFPEIIGPPKKDICYATQNRQQVVRQLAPEAQLALVLGSQNSSNSARLKEIAEGYGIPGYLIDSYHEIRPEWFHEGVSAVLVTAGASAPEEEVTALIEHLKKNYQGVVEEQTLIEENVTFGLPKELGDTRGNARSSKPTFGNAPLA